MESVFIAVLDLTPEARIKFCSDSITDILGYSPRDVRGRSCWDYFHRDEVFFAKQIHSRGINLDKAAVLNYCRIRHKNGSWIGCECVFTVVHDVMVASISVYHRSLKASRRAVDGANVRRIFSSSPRDPRYHMLSYLSTKFYHQPPPRAREPRAALFLNRFTRSSTIMFATNGVAQILGLEPDQLNGKSFYYCINEDCLQDAVKCLESAKANDSIAYLRFRFRNPLQSVSRAHSVVMEDDEESDQDEDGGVPVRDSSRSSVEMQDTATPQSSGGSLPQNDRSIPVVNGSGPTRLTNGTTSHSRTLSDRIANEPPGIRGRMADLDQAFEERVLRRLESGPRPRVHAQSSSDDSTETNGHARDAIFDLSEIATSESSQTSPERDPGIEVEAVISCTSDGLVVVLRKARTSLPRPLDAIETSHYASGLFASPWAPEPYVKGQVQQPTANPRQEHATAAESAETGFMAAIRDVAVFAWSLTGINGSLAQYGVGQPSGEALPPGGLPVWDPTEPNGKLNDSYNGFSGSRHRPLKGDIDPRTSKTEDSSSSEDEILWKREPTMTPWRRPNRRAHGDAFGDDGTDGFDGQGTDGSRKKMSRDRGSG